MLEKKIKIPESGPKKVVFDCKKAGCFVLHVSEKMEVTLIHSGEEVGKDENFKTSGLNIIINLK